MLFSRHVLELASVHFSLAAIEMPRILTINVKVIIFILKLESKIDHKF